MFKLDFRIKGRSVHPNRMADELTKAIKEKDVHIGLVGMRVDSRTRSATELAEFLKGYDFPLVTNLRDTQVYVHAARDGLSVFDMASGAPVSWQRGPQIGDG